LNQPTLALANVPARKVQGGASSYVDSTLVVQVVPQGINLVEYDAALDSFNNVGNGWFLQQQKNAEWRSKEIVAASVNPSQFAIALNGGTVLLLNLSQDGQINLVQ
jgi:DNA damage-binding protein 1